ncbi:MAG: FGGY family carbohydrate kinase [Candidatus Latescibacterota bacterium]
MTPYLLIDFGTTSTKATAVDLDTGTFSPPRSFPSVTVLPAVAGHSELSLEGIAARFDEICCQYRDAAGLPLAGIVLCSEMHGFAVLDRNDRPLTPYIGWRDERSLERIDEVSTFDLVIGRLGSSFKAVTGMNPRPGFPLLNLIHLGRQGLLPAQGRVVSLPGWLARISGDGRGLDHPTLLAGMTYYDVARRKISTELLDLTREMTGFIAELDRPAAAGEVAGYWRHGEERIPILVAAGDHQCSVLGAGLTPGEALSLNLGTGSQASVLRPDLLPEAETRPYFDDLQLQAITHVPAGRALAEYVGFLETAAGGAVDYWHLLGEIPADEAVASDLEIDLAIFPGARGYKEGGRIGRVHEGRLTPRHYLASLLRCLAAQYAPVFRALDPEQQRRRCLLSGGIARRLPVLQELIERYSGYTTEGAAALDESLIGLRALALVGDGRAATCLEAWQLFGRRCPVDAL